MAIDYREPTHKRRNQMFNLKVKSTKSLGKFEVKTGKLRVSDPCYDLKVWCAGNLGKVRKGSWNARAVFADRGGRVAGLMIHHCSVDSNIFDKKSLLWEKTGFEVGVDSGQCGFFDLGSYREDKLIDLDPAFCADKLAKYSEDGDRWYRHCCDITLARMGAGVLPGGVVSSSGYGDGNYDCFFTRKNGYVIAAVLVFISDEED